MIRITKMLIKMLIMIEVLSAVISDKNKDKYTKSKIPIFPSFNNSFPTIIIDELALFNYLFTLAIAEIKFSFRLLDDRQFDFI